ncbi:MAG: hypothetical protein K6F69_05645 [Treponema sp.]|nr:hypothetical protein [Treponema sp.]
MKSPIILITAYLRICLLGSVGGGTLYMLYHSCMLINAGIPLSFFSLSLFVTGAFHSFPIAASVTPLFLTLHKIRHPVKGNVAYLIVYVLLSILTWGVVLPLSAKYSYKFDNISILKKTEHIPSVGYFRPEKSCDSFDIKNSENSNISDEAEKECILNKLNETKSLVYYSKIDSNKKATGIYIQPAENAGLTKKTSAFTDLQLYESSDLYVDSLIEESINLPGTIKYIIHSLTVIIKQSLKAFSEGIIAWLTFSLMGLALFSVIGISSVSHWRLVNVVITICASIFIYVVNIAFYDGTALKYLSENDLEIVLTIFNVVVFLVFSLTALLKQNISTKSKYV